MYIILSVFYIVNRRARIFMEMEVTGVIAGNAKRFREQRKLTLDAAAALTGVSRSMLAQIEKGDVNPTISTSSIPTCGSYLPGTIAPYSIVSAGNMSPCDSTPVSSSTGIRNVIT